MKRNLITAIVLAALLCSLVAIAIWDDRVTKKEAEVEQLANLLVDIEPSKVERLVYKNAAKNVAKIAEEDDTTGVDQGATNQEADRKQETGRFQEANVGFTVELEKREDVWWLVKPKLGKADQATVSGILETLDGYKYAKQVAAGEDQLTDYGLASPAITITWAQQDEPTKTIFIGDKSPIGYSVYSKVVGSPEIFVGSQHLLVSTNKKLQDFRDKSIASIDIENVRRVTYFRADPMTEIDLTKTEQGFAVTSVTGRDNEGPWAGDAGAVRELLAAINDATAEGFVDVPSAELKETMQRPDYTVGWESSDTTVQTANFVKDGDKLLAEIDDLGLIYELPASFSEKLDKEFKDFRNRRMLDFDSAKLELVELDGQLYKNRNGEWYRLDQKSDGTAGDGSLLATGTENQQVSKDQQPEASVRALLVDLEFAKADDFLNADDTIIKGLPERPEHRLVLTPSEAKDEPIVLEAYKLPGYDTKVYVSSSRQKEWMAVPADVFGVIAAKKPVDPVDSSSSAVAPSPSPSKDELP